MAMVHFISHALKKMRWLGALDDDVHAAGVYGVSLWKAQADGSLLQEGELAGHNSIVRR